MTKQQPDPQVDNISYSPAVVPLLTTIFFLCGIGGVMEPARGVGGCDGVGSSGYWITGVSWGVGFQGHWG